MSTHSTDGREWAKYSQLKDGDKLLLDTGFNCIEAGEVTVIQDKDMSTGFYFICNKGRHYLDGQLDHDDHEHLVGCWPINTAS